MTSTDPSSSEPPAEEPAASAGGWPILVTQAGKHGNRGVMLPATLSRETLRSVVEAMITADEDASAVKSVPVGGDAFTLVSRRVQATGDGTVRVWNTESRQPFGDLAAHRGIVSAVSLSTGGMVAATAGWDSTVWTWDTRTGRPLTTITGSGHFSGCALDPGGRTVATTDFDGTVAVYHVRSGERLTQLRLPVYLPGTVAFDARVVYAGAQDGTVQRVRDGQELEPFAGHEGPVTAIALSPGGRLLAGAGRDGTILLWDLESEQQLMRLSEHAGGVTACVFLDADRLLTAGWDGVVRLWNLTDRRSAEIWADPSSAIRALAVAAGTVAISSQNGEIRLVDPAGRSEPVVLRGAGEGHVDTMAGAAQANVLVTGSTNDSSGGAPVRDGFGRPATFTEGLLTPGTEPIGEVAEAVWHRVHAESVIAMGIASADPRGRAVVAAPRLRADRPAAVEPSRQATPGESFRLAAYAVCIEREQVLLARYVAPTGDTQWTLPGGKVEHAEDPIDSVVRELAEETGCDGVVERLLGVDSRVIPAAEARRGVEHHNIGIFYQVRVTGGALRPEPNGETAESVWTPISEVAGLRRSSLVDIGLALAQGLPPTGHVAAVPVGGLIEH